MKHYTQKELTGRTAKQQKIDRVVAELHESYLAMNNRYDELDFDERERINKFNKDAEERNARRQKYIEAGERIVGLEVKPEVFYPVNRTFVISQQQLDELCQRALCGADYRVVKTMVQYLFGIYYLLHERNGSIGLNIPLIEEHVRNLKREFVCATPRIDQCNQPVGAIGSIGSNRQLNSLPSNQSSGIF